MVKKTGLCRVYHLGLPDKHIDHGDPKELLRLQGLDAEKIWLGKGARKFESQPVILGDSLEVLLNDLFSLLGRLGRRLGKAKTVDKKPIPALNTIGPVVTKASRKYKKRINPKGKSSLKSKKVFVE